MSSGEIAGIVFAVFLYIVLMCTMAALRGYELGYQRGQEDCKAGVTRKPKGRELLQ